MGVNVERTEQDTAVLHIEVDKETVGKALDRAFKRIARRVNIPGFRKGKAPRSVVERHVGKENLMEDALEELVDGGYRDALTETGLEPIDRPQIKIDSYEYEGDLKFTATVSVKPEVKLGDYMAVRETVTREEVELTEEELEENVNDLRERMAKLVPAEDQTAASGKFVVVDTQVSVEGHDSPMDKVEGQTLHLGSENVYPEITEALDGAAPGDTRQATITLGDDYEDEQLRGKQVHVTIELKEVKEKHVPELDDELAKQVGGFDSVQELKQDLKNRLLQFKQARAERDYREQIISKITADAEVDVPEILIQRYFDSFAEEFKQGLEEHGITREQYCVIKNTTSEEIDADMRERAERVSTEDLILDAIAKKEQVQVTPEDIDFELQKYSKVMNKPVPEIVQILQANNKLGDIMESLIRKKTLALVADGSADAWRQQVEPELEVPDAEEEQAEEENEEGDTA